MLRSTCSCAWIVFVSLQLEYSQVIEPFSLNLRSYAFCFKGK